MHKPVKPHRRAAAAAIVLAAAVLLAIAAEPVQVPHRLVMVRATPTVGAAAVVWDSHGRQTIPPWGKQVRIDDAVQISVFTRAGVDAAAAAGCEIWIDGQLVRSYQVDGAEMVASCAWPDTDPGLSPQTPEPSPVGLGSTVLVSHP